MISQGLADLSTNPFCMEAIRVSKVPFYPFLVLLLVSLCGYLGCDPANVTPSLHQVSNTASSQVQYSPTIPARTPNTILIGSFNLQRLGPSKMGDSWVMDRLAEIIRQVDLIALQEITDSSGQALPALVDRVNQGGGRYSFVVSPRIGRQASGYFEQYAYVFDTNRIAGGPDYCYMVGDEQDLLHREPFIGRFATRSTNPFTVTLMNVHTDPDELKTELDDLAALVGQVRNYEYPEDDVILLGDINEGPGKLRGLEQIPGWEALIREPTNTRKSRTLDNFLLDRRLTAEFTGRAGTIDMEAMFAISRDEALKLSDHQPVWAEFTINESTETQIPRSASLEPPGRF